MVDCMLKQAAIDEQLTSMPTQSLEPWGAPAISLIEIIIGSAAPFLWAEGEGRESIFVLSIELPGRRISSSSNCRLANSFL